MDPLTLAYASATVLLVGNLAQFALRLMGDRKSAPTEVGTDVCEKIIRGRIYEHEAHCHNLELVMARIDGLAKVTREDLLNYRNELASRLEAIEGKLDRHIERGG